MRTASKFCAGVTVGSVVFFRVLVADPAPQASHPQIQAPLRPPLPPVPVLRQTPSGARTNRPATAPPQVTPVPSVVPVPADGTTPPGALVPQTSPIPRPGPIPITPASASPLIVPYPAAPASPLVWDADVKEYTAKPGETNAEFTFELTNTGPTEVLIGDVRTSCGCTVARLPEYPWRLAPCTNGQIHVNADLRGRRGLLHKMIYVYAANYGVKSLAIKVNMPDPLPGATGDRTRNLQIATADRQAVFKNDCAKCHAEPAAGKKGAELYTAACAICHDAEHRASMVPDLRVLDHPTGPEHWKAWVAHGKAGSLMPAFASSEGGPLTDQQIDSLVGSLIERIPSRPGASTLPASK